MGQKTDYFLEIASSKHPADTTDKEIMAPDIRHREMSHAADRQITSGWIEYREPDFKEQTEEFEKAIEELDRKYSPFMKNLDDSAAGVTEIEELKEFRFRYLDKGERFTDRFVKDDGLWEKVIIPDYRGPGHDKGKWKAYYSCRFRDDNNWRKRSDRRVILAFQCVDYIAEIYVNGNFVGRHEGFFAPFSFDISDYLDEVNEITVLCINDITVLGTGPYLDGDKIYAATGPGWDDPAEGWHHCPAGAGVFGRVTVELRPEIYINDVFVRYLQNDSAAEIRAGIFNYTDNVLMDYELEFELKPRNFVPGDQDMYSDEQEILAEYRHSIRCIGAGSNEYRFYIPLGRHRLWDTEKPYLYNINIRLEKDRKLIDSRQDHCGFRSFVSDETEAPRGRFYLNQKPVVLRGANEMGHLQQCVMQGDMELLKKDILIAKYCGMNYYRVTQRPVQKEIYDYFDMLGMMNQSDLPLFSYLRRPQFAEAVKQTVEMEHLIRNHVSAIMVTFINEPVCIRKTGNPEDKFSRRYEVKGNRMLLRDELEAFFSAARKAVYLENPDRVIKNVEGDYDGPTKEGMPDFHTYTMWYTSHGEPIGRLMRGYLPPVKEGWMTGCGEYGAEGLDNEEVMRTRYPEEWIRESADGHWSPDRIPEAQTYSVHGDWYPEQQTMKEWISSSQLHQAEAARLMTDAFRRRADIINQTAIHLLIDAWPSGWMKTLVGCDRKPKPAFFAYRNALTALKGNLYAPRTQVYEGENAAAEVWIMNDTSERRTVLVQVVAADEGQISEAWEETITIGPVSAEYLGDVTICPDRKGRDRDIKVYLRLLENDAEIYHEQITVKARVHCRINEGSFAAMDPAAERIISALQLEKKGSSCSETEKTMICCGYSNEVWQKMYEHVMAGGKGVIFLSDTEAAGNFGDYRIETGKCGDRFFVAADVKLMTYDIKMLYNELKGYIDVTADRYIASSPEGEELLYTYDKQGFTGNHGAKKHLPIAVSCRIGRGILILSTLCLEGRLGCNPDLDRLIVEMMR